MDPRANQFQPSGGSNGGGAHHPHFGYSTGGISSIGYAPVNPPPAVESSTTYRMTMGQASMAANMYSGGGGGVGSGGVAEDAYYGAAATYDYHGGDVGYSHPQSAMQQGPMAMGGGVGYEMEHNTGGGGGGGIATPTLPLKPGSFFSVEPFQPQLNGAPISALAYDDTYNAIFVASVSKSFSRGGGGGGGAVGGGAGGGGGRWLNHRASTLVTHSTTDGMLYSCVAGHPEAPAKVLNTLYGSIFVQGLTTGEKTSIRHSTMMVPPPPHAYRPYFGTVDPALPDAETGGRNNSNNQMGINKLLPLGQGYVASVSPAGVRVHAHGGLQVADLHVEGMLDGTIHPNFRHRGDQRAHNSTATHITVGGMSIDRDTSDISAKQYQVSCLDVWQGLRPVTSYNVEDSLVAVTAMAANPSRGSIIAGCNDGFTRVLDDRLRQVAKVKSHLGGVISVAVSDDGTLFATTGYGSRCTPQQYSASGPYCFPDMVKVYDIRYLGRGGIAHNFAGLGGGPRHLAFLPPGVVAAIDDDATGDSDSHRLLVASGQGGGGMQIITPFHDGVNNASASNFILPQLERSESITALTLSDDMLGIGTSKGQLLQYRMSGYQEKVSSPSSSSLSRDGGVFVPSNMARGKPLLTHQRPVEKRELEMPSFEPPVPALSLEPTLLLSEDPAIRVGMNDKIKSISTTYTLSAEPRVSAIGDPHNIATTSFGPLAFYPRVEVSKYQVSSNLLSNVTHAMDFLRTVPTSNLSLDLFEDHRGGKVKLKQSDTLLNPNKLLHSDKLFAVAYDKNLNRSKVSGRKNKRSADGETDEDLVEIPSRYRLTNRPTHKLASTFDHAEYNKTDYIPGWDYPPTMPNAFAPPVLLLLNFIPEARNPLLNAQFRDRMGLASREKTLAPELGFLFHRIDTISRNAVVFPANGVGGMYRVGAWAPTNFISCLASLPEAEQLQILDGSPAAVDKARRVEAFYRFLLYQIDKELAKNSDSSTKVMDSLCALDFASVNEFITASGPSSTSSTRALTVEMYYNDYINKSGDAESVSPCFGGVLQSTLCRETRLRAWNERSSSYETIVQRKIATSLPTLLSLSCACAGRKEEEGLFAWRNNTDRSAHWMPEEIEVELAENGNVIVRERVGDKPDGSEDWKEFRGKESIPAPVAELISKSKKDSSPRKRRYKLEAVVSMVRDDLDRMAQDEGTALDGSFVHHVLHARVSKRYKKRVLLQQKDELEALLMSKTTVSLTLISGNADDGALRKRLEHVQQRIKDLENAKDEDEWILVNGYVVERSCSEDARAFHVKFKEPSLIVFRAMDSRPREYDENASSLKVPTEIIKSSSLTNGSRSPYVANQKALPGKGDLIAFDAEFVSVTEEISSLTDAGSKVTLQETRHAIGRISVVDCKSMSVIFDDHVLPREPIVDYLTRFSGIEEKDLNVKTSSRHLVSTRTAYLKLRCLTERGCIFVGHGLNADFWMANVAIPANQIIDTVEIYHKPAQRYVSLRFLTNFVLKRDMQQEIHDSLEDATAAYELYRVAVDLKAKGEFETLLDKLYEYGRKVDWKLGIEDS